MLTEKPPLNQTLSTATPGTYVDTWKPIFAWHLGDVLQHARLDLELDIDAVTQYLETLDDDAKAELDAMIDEMADAYNQRLAEEFCNFSEGLFHYLDARAGRLAHSAA